MKQIQIFMDSNVLNLQDRVNEWITRNNIDVIDVKLSSTENTTETLIIYEGGENGNNDWKDLSYAW